MDPNQYQSGGPCRIRQVRVAGSFQGWDADQALPMERLAHPNGILFQARLPDSVGEGYYEYKYVVEFENGQKRWVGDPCSKYGGLSDDNSAFVLGGSSVEVTPLEPSLRRSGHDLRVYELLLEDFAAEYRGQLSPVRAVIEKLPYLKSLGINAVEFMPWISWPDRNGFSWGYDPAYFFSVESRLVAEAHDSKERLSHLAALISACHQQGLMVILDMVLQHAHEGQSTEGFPYYWLWQNPDDSPFVGRFTDEDTFGSLALDYHNPCTLEFALDVCRYWAGRFQVDGFRFDQVSGYRRSDQPKLGAPALIAGLRNFAAEKEMEGHFPLILEDTWDEQARRHTNEMKASHCWWVPYRSGMAGLMSSGQNPGPWFLRLLNAADQFHYPQAPVLYLESHDRPTLMHSAGGRDYWYRVQPFAIAWATSPGSLMLGMGQEFGRDLFLPDDDRDLPEGQKRVRPRTLRWSESEDAVGRHLRGLYRRLLEIRGEHPGLCSPNFYPVTYQDDWTEFSPEGYGVHQDKGVVLFHRFGPGADQRLELFLVALNFSPTTASVDIPFPRSGVWRDLLNDLDFQVENFRLRNHSINSHWGHIFYQKH